MLGQREEAGAALGPDQIVVAAVVVRARDLSAEYLDNRVHLVVIEGAKRGRPEVAR
jgi:hypothetical protein